jgi:membrane protein DedA with SNARE-associated domain
VEGPIESLLRTLTELPALLIYLIIGAGAAIENVIPPIPADTFVLLGAFLSAQGQANAWVVFFITWGCNVGAAIGVYLLARKYGDRFFETKVGRFLINKKQMDQIGRFYDRWGMVAIFFSRFLPAFRAMVPVFAGVTDKPAIRVLPPLALASGLWYGLLVYLGSTAGDNFDRIMAFFDRASTWLLVVAAILGAAFVFWWIRSRRESA